MSSSDPTPEGVLAALRRTRDALREELEQLEHTHAHPLQLSAARAAYEASEGLVRAAENNVADAELVRRWRR